MKAINQNRVINLPIKEEKTLDSIYHRLRLNILESEINKAIEAI